MNSKLFENKLVWRIALIAIFAVFAGSVWAQDSDDAEEEEEEATQLQKFTVIGSRIKRSQVEGPAPVIVIDQNMMAERGYVTVYEALSDLTINSGFKFEGAEAQLFTPDVQTINLRGFGVGQTLVLINGRRLANYPAAYQSDTSVFNFGAIPVAAIERIEILATGASAIYGSDAVAGVVNLILRSDIDYTTVNVLYGTPTETKSNRNDIRAQILTGKTFERGSFSIVLEYQNRDGITGGDFNQYDQETDYPYGVGFKDRDTLTLDWWVAYFGTGFNTDPPFQDSLRYRDPALIVGTSGEAACAGTQNGNEYFMRPGAGYACGYDGVRDLNFRNEKESYSIFFNGQYEVGNDVELFTDVLYYSGESRSASRGVFISDDILDLTNADSNGIGAAFGLPYDWYLVQRRFNEADTGMNMDQTFDDEALSVSVGARGVWRDNHDWELALNYSEYTYQSTRPWLKYQETIDVFLGTFLGFGLVGDEWWSGGTLGEGTPFGLGDPNNVYGACNDACKSAFGVQTYGNETSSTSVLFTLSGDLKEMQHGPLSYALVLEFEDQDLRFIPDELIQQDVPIPGLVGSGWYKLTGYTGDGDRQRYALGGELRVPLFSTLTLNLAARLDDYDSGSTSFGSNITPSASFEWRPVTSLLVRGGYTESFRAPDMAQVFVSTGFFTSRIDLVQCYEIYVFQNQGSDAGFNQADCDSASIFVERVGSQSLGEQALDAETGYSNWLGFSWDITDNLNVTLDYTKLNLENRVTLESLQRILNEEFACFTGDLAGPACDRADNRIDRQVDPTTGFSFITRFNATPVNQFQEELETIDARIYYNLDTTFGRFRFIGDYTNMLSHTRILEPGEPEIDLKNDPIQGGWDFRSSFTGSVNFTRGDFSTTLTGLRRGSTTVWRCFSVVTGENRCTNGDDRNGSYTTYNWTASYNFTPDFTARLRIVNVTDEKPPSDDTFLSFDDPWYNYFVYPGAGIGRSAALEFEYTFSH